jgi:hypothetical protein
MAIVLNGATSGNVTIDANAISGTSVITLPVGSGTFPLMTLSTAVATTSGTAIDFTSIPSWVKRITVMFNGVSTNGTSPVQIQIGSGSVETSGYAGVTITYNSTGNASSQATTGVLLDNGSSPVAAATRNGHIVFTLLGSNVWIQSGVYSYSNAVSAGSAAYTKTTSSTLDRIRITTVNGTDTFDAGSVNILMEGY